MLEVFSCQTMNFRPPVIIVGERKSRSVIETSDLVFLEADVSINYQAEIALVHTREQNFADAKTCYEGATSSRRFFSFEIVAHLRVLSSRTPFGKNSNEGLEGLLSLRRL